MKKIIVASKNPIKVQAVLKGFQSMFPHDQFEIQSVGVHSGVSKQPQSDRETLSGAWNRAYHASLEEKKADFWVGIEGGIEEKNLDMEVFAWIVIRSSDGMLAKAKTGTFFLPPQVAQLVREGKELGEADDIVFGKINSKQEQGAVGILTDNVMNRAHYYTQAVILALIPFKNKKLYNISEKQY